MIRKFLYILFAICSLQKLSAQTELWVGESYTCDATSDMKGALTSDKKWTISGGYFSTNEIGDKYRITVTQFFSETATVTFSWKERYYPNDQLRPRSRTWKFKCKENPVFITPTSMTLSVGESGYVDYYHAHDKGYNSAANVYFSSSKSGVATVTNSGKVVAIAPGTAYITCYSKLASPSNAPSCKVTVKKIDPTSVSIPSSLTAYVGESSNVSATLYPSNATSTLTWYSENSSIASVSSGIITGKSEGKTTVYVKTSNGLRSNNCSVTVKYRKPSNISLNEDTLYLPVGHGQQLSANVSPSNALYTLEWSSNNSSVAEVSSSGYVTARKQGTARITVTTDNGYAATCVVTVPPMPESLSLPSTMFLKYGKSRTLKCSVEPSDAYLSLTWASSNTEVVKVNQNGEVTACGVGEANITAKAEGGLEAMCKVVVPEQKHCFVVWTKDGKRVDYLMKDHPVVTHEDGNLVLTTRNVRVETPASMIRKYTFEDQTTDPYPTKIEIESMLTLPYKQTMQMDYRFFPADFDIETQLVWQSSAPHIVSVDQSGKLLARCKGEAVVSVTASNGVSASCLVEVTGQQVYLVVWTKDGGKVLYPLNEQPSIKFDGNGNYVVRSSAVEVQYSVADVRMFTLADTDDPRPDQPMDIPDVSTRHNFSYSDNTVRFSSLPLGGKVQVYNASGVLLRNYEVSDDGTASININDLPKGIYIIKTESITHKIIKK